VKKGAATEITEFIFLKQNTAALASAFTHITRLTIDRQVMTHRVISAVCKQPPAGLLSVSLETGTVTQHVCPVRVV
jgi:hypothetical protein